MVRDVIETDYFTGVPDTLFKSEASWRAIITYVAIRYHGKTKASFAKQETMAAEVGASVKVIKDGIVELQRLGFLEITRTGRSNVYRLWPTFSRNHQGDLLAPGVLSDRTLSASNKKKEQEERTLARCTRVDSGVLQTRRNLRNLFSDLYRQAMGGSPPWAAKENAILKALTEQWMNGSRETMEGRMAGAIKAFFDGSNDGVARFTKTAGYELGVFKSQVGKLMATEFVCPKCKGRDYTLFAGDRECATCD